MFVTINGVAVNAATVIDALVAQIAELSLTLAAERAHSRHLSDVLVVVAEDSPAPPRGSEGHTAANGGDPEAQPAYGGVPSGL